MGHRLEGPEMGLFIMLPDRKDRIVKAGEGIKKPWKRIDLCESRN